jgi:hypothetical protein
MTITQVESETRHGKPVYAVWMFDNGGLIGIQEHHCKYDRLPDDVKTYIAHAGVDGSKKNWTIIGTVEEGQRVQYHRPIKQVEYGTDGYGKCFRVWRYKDGEVEEDPVVYSAESFELLPWDLQDFIQYHNIDTSRNWWFYRA